MLNPMYRKLWIGLFVWVVVMAAGSPGVQAQVVAAGSSVEGTAIGDWGAAWWNWAVTEPVATNPVLDTTGEFADANQSGPVWFVAGAAPGETVSRSFQVPAGKHLLFPLINALPFPEPPDGFPTTAARAREVANQIIDAAGDFVFILNGVEVPGAQLALHREQSSDFVTLTVPVEDDLVDAGGTGDFPGAWSDGYYVMLEPLPVGTHTVEFGASQLTAVDILIDEGPGATNPFIFTLPPSTTSITATIEVIPEPTTAVIVVATGGVMLWRRRRG